MKKLNRIIMEAAYDSAMAAMKNKSPEWSSAIDWGKTYLKKQDRVVWYLNVLKKLIADPEDLSVLGGKQSLEAFQESLYHFIGQEIPRVQNYQFTSQPAQQVFADLAAMEAAYRKEQDLNAPVPILPGDYKLIEFADKSVWWFADRAYCKEEGRSGQHCGNVAGQEDTSQRILSYRIQGRVQLTFILLEDGKLGEMKAKANQKPQAKYHPHIMALLLNPIVKGIESAGYLPEMNFSVFDMSPELIAELNQKKPGLISDQISATPHEFLHAPDWVRAIPEYRNSAVSKLPGIAALVDTSGTVVTDNESWERAVAQSPYFIIHAPSTLDNFQSRVIQALTNRNELILQSPKSIRFDFDIINSVCEKSKGRDEDEGVLSYVLPNTPRYLELCLTAVSNNGYELPHIPENLRDRDMCMMAVSNKGPALRHVPENLRDRDMCMAAVEQNGMAIRHVAKNLWDLDMYRVAVKSNGAAIQYVPKNLRNLDMYWAAVKSNGESIHHVPENLRDRDMYMTAVKQDGYAITQIPENLRDRDICRAAVKQNVWVLQYVPENLRDRAMCMMAVSGDKNALKLVPKNLVDRDMCLAAVKNDGYALEFVPDNLRDRDMCMAAVEKTGRALPYVPRNLVDRDMCMTAVKSGGNAFVYVPRNLRDYDMCMIAVKLDGKACASVPEHFRDLEMCRAAVKSNGVALRYVPDNIKPLLFVNESQDLARLRQLIKY